MTSAATLSKVRQYKAGINVLLQSTKVLILYFFSIHSSHIRRLSLHSCSRQAEYFATIGFPLLNDSLNAFRSNNRGHQIDLIGVVINNSSYHYSGNKGGPERKRAIREIRQEAEKSGWHIFGNQIPLSREFPKMMRGDFTHCGMLMNLKFLRANAFKDLA